MVRKMIHETLPKERIEGLRYLYIVIDSNYNVHYEFDNKGHIVLPVHKTEILPWQIYKNLPNNLIRKCESKKKNIVGVLQLWIYYTKDYSFGRIRALGVMDTFRGNRVKTLLRLVRAMDEFCMYYNIMFVEAATKVIPHRVMERVGFGKEPQNSQLHRLAQFIFRQTNYVKRYF